MVSAISISAMVAVLVYLLWAAIGRNRSATGPALLGILLSALLLDCFELLAVTRPASLLFWRKCSLIVESLLPAAWLWFSLTFSRAEPLRQLPLRLRLLPVVSLALTPAALLLPLQDLVYAPDFPHEKLLFLGGRVVVFYCLILLCLMIALINLEQTLLHTVQEQRRRIRPALLGAGALLVIQIIYYSQALVFHALNLHLSAMRGVMVSAFLVLLVCSLRQQRCEVIRVRVSQQLAYRSLALVAAGLYLIGLGVVGQAMKYFGNAMQHALLLALLLLAGLGLLLILFSETARRRSRLFIHRNFYGPKYDYRVQWLRFTDRLSSAAGSDELLNALIASFCDTFGMERGVLLVLEQEQRNYRFGSGMGVSGNDCSIARHDLLVQRLMQDNRILDLKDEPELLQQQPWQRLAEGNRVRFVIPLEAQGELEGIVLLGYTQSTDERYDVEDVDLMGTLARQASAALSNLRLTEQLARTRELAALGKVSAFVVHDLKNLVSALSLTLDNGRRFITEQAFQEELLTSIEGIVSRMQGLISRLRQLPEQERLQCCPVDLLLMAQETVALVKGAELQVTGVPVVADGDREKLQEVALNLIMNAVEATDGKQPVTVEVGEQEAPFFRVRDHGGGIPDHFLHKLLVTPFLSTKKQGMGIGLYQSRQIVEAHGGSIEVVSSEARGSEFTVWLPRQRSENMWQEGLNGKAAHC